jgi:hypothetical protein
MLLHLEVGLCRRDKLLLCPTHCGRVLFGSFSQSGGGGGEGVLGFVGGGGGFLVTLSVGGVYSENALLKAMSKGTVFTRHQSRTKAREQSGATRRGAGIGFPQAREAAGYHAPLRAPPRLGMNSYERCICMLACIIWRLDGLESRHFEK